MYFCIYFVLRKNFILDISKLYNIKLVQVLWIANECVKFEDVDHILQQLIIFVKTEAAASMPQTHNIYQNFLCLGV